MVIFQFLFTATATAALFIFTSQLIPNKLGVWKIIVLSSIFALFSVVKTYFDVGTFPFMLIGVLAAIYILCLPIFIFKGKMWRKYAIYLFFFVLMVLSDSMGSTLITVIYGNFDIVISETTPMLLYNGFALTIYVLFGSISVLAWKMIAARKFQPFFLLFFILPISQFITVYSFVFSTWSIFWLLGVLISIIASLVLLVYTISQEKKTALEEELRETRHAMELENFHYLEVEKRREELAKIRHDFNNQLASIGQLIKSGNEESAQNMIYTLSEKIAETRDNPYCEIPVINAILTEKAQECAAAGIGFVVELILPDTLTVENLHLGSIFGNLLDNAINACKLIDQTDTPTIKLTSMIDGDYLFIKVVNPSSEPSKKAQPGRGYGSRILSDLAARYGGDYRTEYRDGEFTAVMSLLAVGGANV